MKDVNQFVKQIQTLQNNVNDAIVKRDTQISKRQSIIQQIQQLQEKCKKQFGCTIEQLYSKKQQYQNQMNEKIKRLKKVLGIDE